MTSRRVEVSCCFYTSFLCFALTVLAVGGCSPRDSDENRAGDRVEFSTADGFRLVGKIHRASGERPPGLILVHMLGTDRGRWAHFMELAGQAGYTSLAYDMRGHGESRQRNGVTVSFRSFNEKDWVAALADIAAAKETLLNAGVDPQNIAIVGASLGANLALRFAKDDPQIQAVVLLSPGETYRGIEVVSVMEHFRRRPVLILATEGDTYSAASGAKLQEVAPGFSELRMHPGSAHGTDLLDAHPDATGQILFWLQAIFEGESAEIRPDL
ncbi:MAG: alpha/beta fold hydrolase [Candidatus Hydrogenedentes bacterium]|nr:alpha/beta fold hydrolase [Candidatus Hydrogenedentota bacterium]